VEIPSQFKRLECVEDFNCHFKQHWRASIIWAICSCYHKAIAWEPELDS
jgi:hypothetical protein